MIATDIKKHKLDFFIKSGHIKLERGMVISKETMAKYPGDFPVYSSSIANNGLFGKYGKFMFDEEMITWSVDGGGNFFYRPKHKFSVTNVSGILRLTSNKFFYKYLYYLLVLEHGRFTFDYVEKAHPSVIRDLYDIPDIDLKEQQKIAEVLTTIDEAIEKTDAIIEKNKRIKQGLMQDLFRYGIDEHGNIRSEKTHKFKTVRIGNEEMRIPEEWENKKFSDVSVIRQGLQMAISERKHSPGLNRYQYITIQFLNDRASFNDFIENPPKGVICSKEDILVVRTGNMGMVVTNENGVFHNNFFLVDFDRIKLIKEWLVYYLRRNEIQNIFQIFAGTTTIPDLKHGNFYDTPCIYPSEIREQLQITSILKSIDDKISTEHVYKQKLLSLKRGLMEDLLAGKVRVNSLIN